MKTPDNIKKGLEHCAEDGCKKCPYEDDCNMADGFSALADDALTLIRRQEADLDTLRQFTTELSARNEELRNAKTTLALRVAQLEAERDALIDAVKDWGGSCAVCKHYAKPEDGFPCRFCAERFPEDEDKISHWEWRGVQKEDSNETT